MQVCVCVCEGEEKSVRMKEAIQMTQVRQRGNSSSSVGAETRRTSLDICNCFAGSHAAVDPHFLFRVHTRTNTHTQRLNKSKMIHTPSRNFTCAKRAQGTSGYWILTMKLQRLHSNGGDEVRSWDGNHKLIPLTWQATRPWLPPNTALPSSTEVRKTPREGNTRFIINFGSKECHNRQRTHTICLILFWCDYCTRWQPCNLHVWLHLCGLLLRCS